MINLQNDDVFDAVVVGAGPCGAAAAKRLVESGANVLIIEGVALTANEQELSIAIVIDTCWLSL